MLVEYSGNNHCNCIVCLVVESALHVYKGQFSPWFGQFTIQISQEFTMGILIQWKFIISASGTVQSKHLTSRLGVSKTLRFGLNLMSSLHISLTFRFCQLQVKYKSSLLSTFLAYDYKSIGSLSWFVPRSSMSLRSLASTSDTLAHLQRIQINLQDRKSVV